MDIPNDLPVPTTFQISRQLDQEKINFLTKRIDELIKSNNKLRISSGQTEKDTHDIVLYFQREMEIKDDVILKLNEDLIKCQTQLKMDVDKVKNKYEEELTELRTSSESTIEKLRERLDEVQNELKSVYAFKQAKDLHEGTIARLERSLQKQREQLIDAMEEQERKGLEEKSNLLKDLDDQKIAFREVALREARLAMGEEAQMLLADNNRLIEELRFHQMESAELVGEKQKLESQLTLAKREITIFGDQEVEYAKQAHLRTKEIKLLRDRVDELERQHSENLEKYRTKTKDIRSSVSKDLQEAQLDAAGLRRLIQVKNKELKHMKGLAATILTQRTETEQFFLESLAEVKEVIKKERQLNRRDEKKALIQLRSGKGLGGATGDGNNARSKEAMFPPLDIKGSNLHLMETRTASNLQNMNVSKVTLKDLSWDDKELVLRVLFAKINGSSTQRAPAASANYDRSRTMPNPVFISEGANMPMTERAANYQENFEIKDDNEAAMRNISRGTDKSLEFDYESIELDRSSPGIDASRMSTDADFSRFTLENY